MPLDISALVCQKTQCQKVSRVETLHTLWSGYGSIKRYLLAGGDYASVIVKHVRLPEQQVHPRGWNTSRSHQRKIRSYEIEAHWYTKASHACDSHCRVAHCFESLHKENEFVMVLEDLNASGFPQRLERATPEQMAPCIRWLAHFHARFMGRPPQNLWPTGSYWHLETRPDEWQAMADSPLKRAAATIDRALNSCRYQTLIHGDAKLANFCFTTDFRSVAAVDFQYVGTGCGMKDLAYFIGSCLDEAQCEQHAFVLLDLYFEQLTEALQQLQPQLIASEVEQQWRPLFAYAWADFHRFLEGWSPDHWKLHRYSQQLTNHVLQELGSR